MGLLLAWEIAKLAPLPNFLGRRQPPVLIRRNSHSRPEEVPLAKRERMLQRPRDTYKRHTGNEKGNKELYFANWPLDPSIPDVQDGRNPRFGHWRKRLKQSRTPSDLLESLRTAMKKDEVDISVFSSAMQSCGHNRWWGPLLEVYEAQNTWKLPTNGVNSRIFLTALASCVKDRRLPEAVLARRGKQALQLGKCTWQAMPAPTAEFDFGPALSSVWNLCAAIGPEALPWGLEIDKWSETIPLEKDRIAYANLLAMLERCGEHRRVDEILVYMAKTIQVSPGEVTLGNLVNEAGMLHNWSRADQLWDMITCHFAVKPNCICYSVPQWYPFFPFWFGVSLLKQNSRKRGPLLLRGYWET